MVIKINLSWVLMAITVFVLLQCDRSVSTYRIKKCLKSEIPADICIKMHKGF